MRRYRFRIVTFMRFVVFAAVGFTVSRRFLESFESGVIALVSGVLYPLIAIRRYRAVHSPSPAVPDSPATAMTLEPTSGEAEKV
jgi:hypothetical protein